MKISKKSLRNFEVTINAIKNQEDTKALNSNRLPGHSRSTSKRPSIVTARQDDDLALEERALQTKLFDDIHEGKTNSKLEIEFDKHAEELYTCDCNVCMIEARRRKSVERNDASAAFFRNFDFHQKNNELEKDFTFILKRLIPPKHIARSLRLFVPDMACFIAGEAKLAVMTGKVNFLSICD